MKKIFSILISSILLLSTNLPIYAITPSDSYEYINNDDSKYDYIKSVLSNIGMGSYFIERLDQRQLDRYYNAIVRAYNKESFANALTINSTNPKYSTSPLGLTLPGEIIKDPDDDFPIYTKTYSDQWMIIFLMVTDMGDGRYSYSVDASWQQLPGNRYTDSLGIIAQESRVDYITAYGWHEGEYLSNNGNTSYSKFEYDYDPNDSHFRMGENGSWSGLAYIFEFPSLRKVISDFSGTLQTVNVHFEYEALVSNLSNITPFSVSSNYDHTVTTINIDTSFGVSLSTSPSIGFNFNVGMETHVHRRICMLDQQLVYYP